MNLQEWRQQRQSEEEALLPSGLTVTLRRVSVLDLAEQGKIPQTLMPQLDMFIKSGAKASSLEMIAKMGELITLTCRAALTGPEGLDAAELPFTDRLAVFTWLNEDASKVQSFRLIKEGTLAA